MAICENLYPRKIIPYTHVYSVYPYMYTLTLAAMALYRYFSPSDSASLPPPKGFISTTLSPAAIRGANDAVKKVGMLMTEVPTRGAYAKVSSEQQAKIIQCTSLHGNPPAACQFS